MEKGTLKKIIKDFFRCDSHQRTRPFVFEFQNDQPFQSFWVGLPLSRKESICGFFLELSYLKFWQ